METKQNTINTMTDIDCEQSCIACEQSYIDLSNTNSTKLSIQLLPPNFGQCGISPVKDKKLLAIDTIMYEFDPQDNSLMPIRLLETKVEYNEFSACQVVGFPADGVCMWVVIKEGGNVLINDRIYSYQKYTGEGELKNRLVLKVME
jgi:hypothetical protein